MKWYHVSPNVNDASIARLGIDPIFTQGAQELCWFVEYKMVAWAIAHCAAKHKVHVSDLTVHVVETPRLKKQRATRWTGVWSTPCNHKPSRSIGAQAALTNVLNNRPF